MSMSWATQQVQTQLHNETCSQQQQQQQQTNQKRLHNKDPTEASYLNKEFKD